MSKEDICRKAAGENEKIDHGRREALQKIAVGAGVVAGISILPETWTQPIIGRIVLPAHAATSGSSLHDPCAVELRSGDSKSEAVTVKVTGFVTPPAANLPVTVTATAVGGAGLKAEAKTTTDSQGNFEAFLTVGGGPNITSVTVTTSVSGADGVANCAVNTTTQPSSSSSLNSCSEASLLGEWSARGTALENYPVSYFTLAAGGIATNVTDGDNNARANGSWSLSGNTLTLIFPWFDPDFGNGTDTYVLTLNPDCSHSATGTVTMSNGVLSETMGAAAPSY